MGGWIPVVDGWILDARDGRPGSGARNGQPEPGVCNKRLAPDPRDGIPGVEFQAGSP